MPGFNTIAAAARLRIAVRSWFGAYGAYKRIYHPLVDLGIRLSLAGAFLHSGMVKAMDWPSALYLARHEYPLSWLSPERAAVTGLAIELICPIFLAAGLFTRAAALPMAIMALVIQADYRSSDTNLLWAALLFSYVVFGARGLSVDTLIGPGLSDSALPLAPRLINAGRWFKARVGPPFQLLLRLWLGWALLRLPAPLTVFPVASAHALLPTPLSVAGGAMLVLGLGAMVVNKVLGAAVVGTQMMTGTDVASLWLILCLARLGILDSGPWSLDALIYARLLAWLKPSHGRRNAEGWLRVTIVGAGFGGMACANKLRHLPVHVTLIDQHNYHLFQPLLYQVATASLSPADIASPIRSQFRDDPSVQVRMGVVTGVDLEERLVRIGDQSVRYDRLVIATGASHGYFGREDWSAYAPGLKRIEDATAIRSKLLTAFERAENAADDAERERWLTFVVVGGGPTGVELAGAIAELARFGLEAEFRHIDPASARIVLVQAGARVLPSFDALQASRAQRSLQRLGVEVRIDSRVRDIDALGVMIDGFRLRAGTVFWAAGVVASPAAAWLGAEPDRAGRVPVDAFLRVPGRPDVFVLGDTAACSGWRGQLVPGLAPAAKQGGEYVAGYIRTQLEMRPPPPPFAYRHRGNLATIGRSAAVAEFGRLRIWGAPAWWLWGALHIAFLSGVRSRLSVALSWTWAYLTFRRAIRLITDTTTATPASPTEK